MKLLFKLKLACIIKIMAANIEANKTFDPIIFIKNRIIFLKFILIIYSTNNFYRKGLQFFGCIMLDNNAISMNLKLARLFNIDAMIMRL